MRTDQITNGLVHAISTVIIQSVFVSETCHDQFMCLAECPIVAYKKLNVFNFDQSIFVY